MRLFACTALVVGTLAFVAGHNSNNNGGNEVLDGQWTRLTLRGGSNYPLHDSLQVSRGKVKCEHGGWENLRPQACSFDTGEISTLPQSEMVAFRTQPGRFLVPIAPSPSSTVDSHYQHPHP